MYHKAIFAKQPMDMRKRPKAVGSNQSHLTDTKVTYAERKERSINRVRSECPKVAAIHDTESARIQRRYTVL